MYQLAIFDLDGTLLDTVDDLANACNRALRLSGYPEHPRDAYKLFVGGGVKNLIYRALPPEVRDTAAIRDRVGAVFGDYYRNHAQDLTRPYDGAEEMLTRLRNAGVRVAVLSNKPDAYTGVLVEQYFPGVVDLAYGQREGVPIKPDPTAVYEIMGHFDVCKENCVYIGDSGSDMVTGRNAGLDTIGVLWGFRTKKELEESGAAYIVDKMEDLVKIILDK